MSNGVFIEDVSLEALRRCTDFEAMKGLLSSSRAFDVKHALYPCDRKKCAFCTGICELTTDRTHAEIKDVVIIADGAGEKTEKTDKERHRDEDKERRRDKWMELFEKLMSIQADIDEFVRLLIAKGVRVDSLRRGTDAAVGRWRGGVSYY